MSKLTFSADGSIIKNNRTIESMSDTDTKPLDYFNLAGNLKLAGSIRATNFIKEDGTVLEAITVNKLALPENVYYLNKRVGINEENPQSDFDVKGTTRLQGALTGSDALFSGSFISQGPTTFSGLVTAEDEFIANKNAGVRGNLGVVGDFGTQGTSTFRGLVTAEDEFIANKNAGIRGNLGVAGNFGTQGTATFKGPVIASEDITATRHLNASGNANVAGDITFNGANKWIIHTPDDKRRIMYMAPGNDKGEWMWDKQTMFNNDGSVQLSGPLMLGGQNVPHPDNSDGAFYRADGQIQIATDDLIRLRHVGSKATGIQFDVSEGAGDVNTPNGQMKISRQGIMFGGPNNAREVNSGQISAGLHIPNSLNIVGMSADKGAASRRIDMWAEGGLNVYGPQRVSQNIVIGDSDGAAGLAVKGTTHEHGTAWLRSDKGPNVSHVHWGPNGDWYIRSAKPEGSVVIQDSSANGNTTVGSNLNLKGGVSRHNPDKSGTHFPFSGDQKNYIRGDTEIRGDTNNVGILRVATNGGASDANGEQLVIGNTNESNLRLGRHSDYSWIQSHGSKPLKINPLGNDVCIQDVCLNNNDIKNLKLGSNSMGFLLVKVYGDNGQSVGIVNIPSDKVTNDMDILALSGIGLKNNSKGSVYFNIALKQSGGEPKTSTTFSVISDDGVSFEYKNNDYLMTNWEVNINDPTVFDRRGWKDQGDTKYDYVIPNVSLDSIHNIVRCRLTWYNGGGGSTFKIQGLKSAIDSIGRLV